MLDLQCGQSDRGRSFTLERQPVIRAKEWTRMNNRMEISEDVFFAHLRTMVSEGHSVSIRVRGNSMMPFLRSGKDSVVLSPLEREPQVGDILLAVCNGKHILHRVISVGEEAVTLMGDGNLRGTEECRKSDIIAIVTEVRRNGGRGHIPGKGRFWRAAGPLRRAFLGIYRRLCPRDFNLKQTSKH